MEPITLKTLPEASAQEVFNHVVRHLHTQNAVSRESLDGTGICVYKSKNGLKCAAGSLLADEEYKDSFECRSWDSLVNNKEVPAIHKKLIVALQLVHDNTHPDYWGQALLNLALDKGLNPHMVEELYNLEDPNV